MKYYVNADCTPTKVHKAIVNSSQKDGEETEDPLHQASMEWYLSQSESAQMRISELCSEMVNSMATKGTWRRTTGFGPVAALQVICALCAFKFRWKKCVY